MKTTIGVWTTSIYVLLFSSNRVVGFASTHNLRSDRNEITGIVATIDDDYRTVFSRATEILSVTSHVTVPLISSGLKLVLNSTTVNKANGENDIWETFWLDVSGETNDHLSNADRVSLMLEGLGPTYVKFAQALAARPDIIPQSLADSLSKLQDKMEPFNTTTAKEIVTNELMNTVDRVDPKTISELIGSLSDEPVAAASIGQVYKGYIEGIGFVAVKVKRPGIEELVRRDAVLLRRIASLLESIPSASIFNQQGVEGNNIRGNDDRFIQTEILLATEEFMSRIFEELDYRNEAKNAKIFYDLYSIDSGSALSTLPNQEGVIVPRIISKLCTSNVIVMEWIEGEKLTSLTNGSDDQLEENLKLVEHALYVTLSQLLEYGVMHADPHLGNLLKVPIESEIDEKTRTISSSKSVKLAYLDFGLISTIPPQVRDGLVCAVAQLIFAKDIKAMASLFGELDLIPEEVLSNPSEVAALASDMEDIMGNILEYPKGETLYSTSKNNNKSVPNLRFDKLLDGLSRLIPRFKFQLPPYFINNARALGTLEGVARTLDSSFNCLSLLYPYALKSLLQNKSGSPVVEATLKSLICNDRGHVDKEKLLAVLRDSSTLTGQSKRRIILDAMKYKGGKKLAKSVLKDVLFLRWCRDPSGRKNRRDYLSEYLRL